MSTKLGCPNCLKPLVRSKDTHKYETLLDHASDPNGTSPERTYLYCSNKDCCLRDGRAFWDDYGDFYRDSEPTGWWQANRIDSFNHTTFRRKGAEAIGSFSREFNDNLVRERRFWWRRLKKRLRNRWGNWGVDLRRNYCPYGLFKPRTDLRARVVYAFGVWIMDPWGCWKPHAFGRRDPDDISVKQWLHHPFPWVSRRAQTWIKSLQEEEEVCP